MEDVAGALEKLWLGDEVELAVAIGIATGLIKDTVPTHGLLSSLCTALARKCETAGNTTALFQTNEDNPNNFTKYLMTGT